MPTDIIMPQMGESIVEGTITKWLKKPGDKVQRDEPLFEISTDKVDAEIPAPASGVLQEIKVSEGSTVGVNTVVGTISVDGEAAAAPAKAAPAVSAPAPEVKSAEKKEDKKPAASAPAPVASAMPAPQPAEDGAEEARSSPLVRKIAREHGINLSQVSGTGLGRPNYQAGHHGFHRASRFTGGCCGTRFSARACCPPFSRSAHSSGLSRRPCSHDEHAQNHCPAHDRVTAYQRSRPLHV